MRDSWLAPVLGWSHLLLLAVGFICSPMTSAFPVKDSNPLSESSDQVRLRHLYTSNAFTSVFLQITPEGEVSASQEQNTYSLMEIKAVKTGIVVIQGKRTSLYLCMNKFGRQYGSESYNEEYCNFHEQEISDGFVKYVSEKYNKRLNLRPLKGKRLTKFLPMKNSITLDWLHEDTKPLEVAHARTVDPESDDPLGMKSSGVGQSWE